MTEENTRPLDSSGGRTQEKIARMKIFKMNEEQYETVSKLAKEKNVSWTKAFRYMKTLTPPLEATSPKGQVVPRKTTPTVQDTSASASSNGCEEKCQ